MRILSSTGMPRCRFGLPWSEELHYAIETKNTSEARRLVMTKVAFVNGRDSQGSTPLIWASSTNNPDMVRTLLELRADVNLTNNGGWTPLITACNFGNLEVAHLLVKAGARDTFTSINGRTALMTAAKHGHLEIIRFLILHANSDINAEDHLEQTALDHAKDANHGDSKYITVISALLTPNYIRVLSREFVPWRLEMLIPEILQASVGYRPSRDTIKKSTILNSRLGFNARPKTKERTSLKIGYPREIKSTPNLRETKRSSLHVMPRLEIKCGLRSPRSASTRSSSPISKTRISVTGGVTPSVTPSVTPGKKTSVTPSVTPGKKPSVTGGVTPIMKGSATRRQSHAAALIQLRARKLKVFLDSPRGKRASSESSLVRSSGQSCRASWTEHGTRVTRVHSAKCRKDSLADIVTFVLHDGKHKFSNEKLFRKEKENIVRRNT
ncbi:hypothetical protein AAMO2058_000507500 [Amorphochlora amoebiformis]